MKLEKIVGLLNLKVFSGSEKPGKDVSGGYIGDLLSDVMANSKEGDIWITRQVHQNIIAVASLKEHAGIVIVHGAEPTKDTIEKAVRENIPVMGAKLPAFEIAGEIYNILKEKNTQSNYDKDLAGFVVSRINVMLRVFRCDLHIHTCLSPCADLDIYPRALIEKSIAEGLDVIAVCDHNASENIEYVLNSAKGKPIAVLPGMEISSREEVHVLAIFDDPRDLIRLQVMIYDHLPGKNREDIFGAQIIVNDLDEVEGINDRLLIGATDLPLDIIVDRIHSLGGLAIASHIDRPSYSILSQLGFIDPSTCFDALEISSAMGIKEARHTYPELSSHAFIKSSDAHSLAVIGRAYSSIVLKEANVRELKMAFAGEKGRFIKEED